MASRLTDEFTAALRAGRVCLHPTDTLPGLTFDPYSQAAHLALARVKGRALEKPCLGLVADLAAACRFYAPLPGNWEYYLRHLWPGPLSVVWQATAAAPASLVAQGGTIGLRVPQLSAAAAWFRSVLEQLQVPLPTTSVNRSGEAAFSSYADAAAFVSAYPEGFVPAWGDDSAPKAQLPSTLIQLQPDGGMLVLREGQWPILNLRERLAALQPHAQVLSP